MSSNYTHGPSLDKPWRFPVWDNLKTSDAPWVHRGFWYHDGDGEYIVFVWKYSYDERDRPSYSGYIHRYVTLLEAIKNLDSYRKYIDGETYDGGLIFLGSRRMLRHSVIGELFPESLPDERW